MYVLKNGQVLNASGELENKDVLIQNGKVNLIADSIEVTSGEEFDATGKLIAPGLSTSMYIFVSRAGNIKKPF